ncbi:hypothetical protein [uncultured Roseobacter sp.]|uniref:hypothetical protein n=1 Tax=uncultured Roseobacter sp. TaxID=114847 RepID=UPI0026136646|nr:hypothetical protein [uncultured Roseobacter sp.]
MARFPALLGLMVLTAACSGANEPPATSPFLPASLEASTAPQFASGKISNACMAHRRKAASQARCGCIQAVANRTLTISEQARGVRFFEEPDLAQAIRTSDASGNEQFWATWSRFADLAARTCEGT